MVKGTTVMFPVNSYGPLEGISHLADLCPVVFYVVFLSTGKNQNIFVQIFSWNPYKRSIG